MENCILPILVFLALGAPLSSAQASEVMIWTGTVSWIDKDLADVQAQISTERLEATEIPWRWYSDPSQESDLATWLQQATNNGQVDVLVLYGYFPSAIYGAGNTQPDGSLAELFIESTDGDAIINHGDYMFYVSDTPNGEAGLQNMMDISGIAMGDYGTPMAVTAEGIEIAPSLSDFFQSDRPFHVDELEGDWEVEAVLAQNASSTRADPIVVRDGDRGRLIPMFQTLKRNDPKGAVAAEVIEWLLGVDLLGDMDCNGNVDFDDIDDFVLGLTDPKQYEINFGVPATLKGDIDTSGFHDFDDIDDFVALLTSSQLQAVPEPGSFLLAAIGLLGLLPFVRQRSLRNGFLDG